MKMRTLIEKGCNTPVIMEWEGDGYEDEPFGEAVVVLLRHTSGLQNNWKVVLHATDGETLTYWVEP